VKKGCHWVEDARESQPEICRFKPGPKGYCKKHERTLRDLGKRQGSASAAAP
jgi:hypothetical protein